MNLLLSLLAAFFSLWPEVLVRLWARVAGWLWYHVIRYRRRVIDSNLNRAFGSAAIGVSVCQHLVLTFLELLRVPRYRRIGLENVVRVEGFEHFEAAKRQGRGVLCLSGHLGSFELCVGAVAVRARPVHLVVKPFSEGTDRFVNRLRQGFGLSIIYAEGAARKVLGALKKGDAVVFVLDQNATRRIGVFVDFFGEQASTMSGLAAIALKTGAPVIAATAFRDEHGKHVLRVYPEIPMEPQATKGETIVHMTQVYTHFIEAQIKEHPEQWFWTHRRWRTRPK